VDVRSRVIGVGELACRVYGRNDVPAIHFTTAPDKIR
jgi:hypothetical protein